MRKSETQSQLELALARGSRRKEELAKIAGGLLAPWEAAYLLGLSPEALHEREAKGDLLAVPTLGGGIGYPAFQFVGGGLLKGLSDLLGALQVHPWMQLNFMLSSAEDLGGLTPLEAVRQGRTATAIALARQFGNHGAR